MKRSLIIHGLVLLIFALAFAQAEKGKSENRKVKSEKQEIKKATEEFNYTAIFITHSKACACTKKRCEAAQAIIDSLDLKSKRVKLETLDYASEDMRERIKEIMQKNNIMFVPALIIFDKDGNKLNSWSGFLNKGELTKFFEELGKPETNKGQKK